MTSNDTARPGIGPVQQPPLERELPMLAGIGAFVTWCEDLLAVLSGPILTAGLAIALVDLLSDGQLFTRLPILLWVWAGSMALGLDAQFIGSSAKLARAMRQRRGWVVFGYTILCISLGYVAFLATYVFAVQEANGLTTSAALARLGMDSTTWIFQRSVLAVVLVFLSGLLRYVPPAKDDALAALSESERLDREIELAPKRAQLRALQARGVREIGAALRGREGQQPAAGHTVKPRIVAASSTLADVQPVEHHGVTDHTAMHDGYDDFDDGIPDETGWNGGDDTLFRTNRVKPISAPVVSDRPSQRSSAAKPEKSSALDDLYHQYLSDDIVEPDDDGFDNFPSGSRHENKRRKNQRQRKENDRRAANAVRSRQVALKTASYTVLNEAQETGENLTDRELKTKVNEFLERGGHDGTSLSVVQGYRTDWLRDRKNKAHLRETSDSLDAVGALS